MSLPLPLPSPEPATPQRPSLTLVPGSSTVVPEVADVVLVGGRISGCATGIRLAEAGLRVVVLERDERYTDAISTHYLQDLGLWDELGVLQEVLDLGAPKLNATRLNMDGVDLSSVHPEAPRMCVRRIGLDEILRKRLERSGAKFITGVAVKGLVTGPDDRVCGVRVQLPDDGGTAQILTSLVIGADGRNSTVARLTGANKYDITENDRNAYWRYYKNLPIPPEFHLVRHERDVFFAVPCDDGVTLVVAQPPTDDPRDWRDREIFEEVAERIIPPLRGLLHRAEQVGDVRVVRRMQGYFRESAGPGWVILGDAGHFKDVITGQGISDALRQSRSLAGYILAAWGKTSRLDRSMRYWWKARDADAKPMYYFSQSFGRSLPPNVLDLEVFRFVSASNRRRHNLSRLLEHRYNPKRLLGVPALAGLVRGLFRRDTDFSQVMAAFSQSANRELGRK